MADSFASRFKSAWNIFRSRDPAEGYSDMAIGPAYYTRPDKMQSFVTNEKSIVSSILTRIGVDVASLDFRHVKLDDSDRYLEDYDSGLNECLQTEANVDQTAMAFMLDVVISMLDEGVVAVVPVDATINPSTSQAFDIKTLRTGKIISWYPYHVKVRLFNQKKQDYDEVIVSKRTTAIIENPLYSVMNEPNSTLKRLTRKLALLDVVDDQSASGKLDLIIQLPYVVKTEARVQQAKKRTSDIEMQLRSSKYGIAYADGTEKITQLNRPVENNLMDSVKYLTTMLYGQLGISEDVLNGIADEKQMRTYQSRTIKPIAESIVGEFKRKFLSKTARTQKQSVMYFVDLFALMPLSDLAEVADKFIRDQIASANEMRQVIGFKPSKEPQADQLNNPNMPGDPSAMAQAPEEPPPEPDVEDVPSDEGE